MSSGCHERPPVDGITYFGFCDPAGDSGADAMTMAVAHKDGDASVLDCLRERRPPFSPASVCEEFASVFRSYRIGRVKGDKWGAQFVVELFAKHGITVEQSAAPKADIHRELLPMLMSGRVRLLDNKRLISELSSLERRAARGGRDIIDHPLQAHDDVANAAAGVLVSARIVPYEIPIVAPFIVEGLHRHNPFIVGPNPFTDVYANSDYARVDSDTRTSGFTIKY